MSPSSKQDFLALSGKGKKVGKSVNWLKNFLALRILWRCVSLRLVGASCQAFSSQQFDRIMTPPTITQLLVAWNQGDQSALEQLTPLVYRELHRLAHGYLAGERQGHILQTTALVNEAFVRLLEWKQVEWQDRAHFFGVSATLMRHILVQFAREQQAVKRGGGQAIQFSLSEAANVGASQNLDLVALDDALDALEKLNSRQSRIIELRFFGGLSLEEVAEVIQVSVGTVRRDWRMAQAWLQLQLSATQ